MGSACYYRQEARRCRELAKSSPDAEAARRWQAIAADYDTLAETLEAQTIPVQRVPTQQQPMQEQQQQQQAKTGPKDEA
jgi:hypothetical protein